MRLPRLSRTTDWSGSVTRSGSPLFASSAITEFLLAANHAAHKAKSASIAAAQYTRGRILPKGFRDLVPPPPPPPPPSPPPSTPPPPPLSLSIHTASLATSFKLAGHSSPF